LLGMSSGSAFARTRTTKNNQGRLVPLVKEVIKSLWQWKQATLRLYPTCVWVCHCRGKRLRQVPRKRWKKACDLAGLKGKIFHDLRRTAIRNMVRAGISERVAMAISGHKTRSVFDRYDIVTESDISIARDRLEPIQVIRHPASADFIEVLEMEN